MKVSHVTRSLLGLSLPLLVCLPGAIRPAMATTPITIGQLVPLTGVFAAAMTPYEQAGATLALKKINAAGGINGRPLQIVQADDQSTPDGAVAAFKQLTQAGQVTALIGPLSSVELQAMTPAIKQVGLPMIIGGSARILTHEGDPWVFRTRTNSIYPARALTEFTVHTLHLTRIAILHASDPASSGQDTALRGDLKAMGITPVTDQNVSGTATDLTPQVQVIKQSGATALISFSAFPALYPLLGRQLRQAGLHLTWLGDAPLSTPSVVRKGGPFLDGTYAVVDYVPSQSPESAAFDQSFHATFHLKSSYVAAYVYDGLQILALVMRKVGTDPQAIRQGILAIKGYHGAMGTYTFDHNGDGLRQENIVQNVRGYLRLITSGTF